MLRFWHAPVLARAFDRPARARIIASFHAVIGQSNIHTIQESRYERDHERPQLQLLRQAEKHREAPGLPEDPSSHDDVDCRRDRCSAVRGLGQDHLHHGPRRGAGLPGRRHRGHAHHAHAGRDGHLLARYRLVLHLRRQGHRSLGRLHHRLAVLVVLGPADGLGSLCGRDDPEHLVPRHLGQRVHPGGHIPADQHQLHERAQLRRIRVLVRADQGHGHRLLHHHLPAGSPQPLEGWHGAWHRQSHGPWRLHAQRLVIGHRGHAGGDVRLPGRRDRHHCGLGIGQPGRPDRQGHQLGGLADLPLLHRLDLPDRLPGALERPASGRVRLRLLSPHPGTAGRARRPVPDELRGAHLGQQLPDLGPLHRLAHAVLAGQAR